MSEPELSIKFKVRPCGYDADGTIGSYMLMFPCCFSHCLVDRKCYLKLRKLEKKVKK